MYITIRSKEQILDAIESSGCWSVQINHILHDRDFDICMEYNNLTSDKWLKAELVVKRNARGIPVEKSHKRCHIEGNLSYYINTNSVHLIVKAIIDMYKHLYDRKRKHEADKITATELTDTMRTFSSPTNVVYYICSLTHSPVRGYHVEYLYKHVISGNLEFVDSDNDSRCSWFYSEKDIKDFITRAYHFLCTYDGTVFVVKSKKIGRVTERTFYNLDLNEERYDLYGPVESCCKRLARHSRNDENKAYDHIYINTASPGPYALTNYIKRDIESSIWAREFINNKLKEIMEEMNLPKIKKVIFNNPATIVFWADESKTIVKCENEEFDPEKGLSMAISKKALGNKHDYYNVFKKWLPKEKKEDKKPTKKNETKKPSNKKNNK